MQNSVGDLSLTLLRVIYSDFLHTVVRVRMGAWSCAMTTTTSLSEHRDRARGDDEVCAALPPVVRTRHRFTHQLMLSRLHSAPCTVLRC